MNVKKLKTDSPTIKKDLTHKEILIARRQAQINLETAMLRDFAHGMRIKQLSKKYNLSNRKVETTLQQGLKRRAISTAEAIKEIKKREVESGEG